MAVSLEWSGGDSPGVASHSGCRLSCRGDTVVKAADDQISRSRLRAQYCWLNRMSPDVRARFPRVLHWDDSAHQSVMVMERFEGITLQQAISDEIFDVALYWNVINDVHLWLADNLYSNVGRDRWTLEQIVRSLLSRSKQLDRIWHPDYIDILHGQTVPFQGEKIMGGLAALERASALAVPERLTKCSLLHGDLHSGNIMITPNGFRLIDHRGLFQNNKTRFTTLYDSGKFLHDFHGMYWALCSGNFKLEKRGGYHLLIDQNSVYHVYEELRERYLDAFVWASSGDVNFEPAYSLLMEGLVLCGASVFHVSHMDRSLALYLSGLYCIHRFFMHYDGRLQTSSLFEPLH